MEETYILYAETSAYKIQPPWNYPEESIHYSERDECSKSITFQFINQSTNVKSANTLTYGIIV